MSLWANADDAPVSMRAAAKDRSGGIRLMAILPVFVTPLARLD
jgi:hypothetical protein